MTVPVLMQQIEETERLIAVYRDANEVIIGTQDEVYSRRGLINRTTLSAAEIGDQIVRSWSAGWRRCGQSSRNSAPNTKGKADDRAACNDEERPRWR